MSVIKKEGRVLAHLSGSEAPEAASSKADWDQYRTNTKALFSPYPGYTVEDAGEAALPNGVTYIYVTGKPREAVARQSSAPSSTPALAPEAAAEDPKNYLKWNADGKSFTFTAAPGSEADKKIRIEQLLTTNAERKLVLTSDKISGEFTFQNGDQGYSWYNDAGQRLVIRAGDLITKKVAEAPLVAAAPSAPAKVVVAGEAPVEVAPIVAAEAPFTESEARDLVGLIEVGERAVKDLQKEKVRVAGRWLVLSKDRQQAQLDELDKKIIEESGMVVKNIALLQAKAQPEFYANLADHYRPIEAEQRRLAKLPPASDAPALATAEPTPVVPTEVPTPAPDSEEGVADNQTSDQAADTENADR